MRRSSTPARTCGRRARRSPSRWSGCCGCSRCERVSAGTRRRPSAPAESLEPVIDSLRRAIDGGDPAAGARFGELSSDVAELAAAPLAVKPQALGRHESPGSPADITRSSLADVGRTLDTYGMTADRPGLVSLLRGDVLAFGRLQLGRRRYGWASPAHPQRRSAHSRGRRRRDRAFSRVLRSRPHPLHVTSEPAG
jgi:hypothetical protein